MAVIDNCLACSGKRRLGIFRTLTAMKQTASVGMKIGDNADFAVVGVFGGSVVLEANEWDHAVGAYRVVTLYLRPEIARGLADQLTSCAGGADQEGFSAH